MTGLILADLDKIDEALMTNDFSDEVLEAVARVDGRPAITIGVLRHRL